MGHAILRKYGRTALVRVVSCLSEQSTYTTEHVSLITFSVGDDVLYNLKMRSNESGSSHVKHQEGGYPESKTRVEYGRTKGNRRTAPENGNHAIKLQMTAGQGPPIMIT